MRTDARSLVGLLLVTLTGVSCGTGGGGEDPGLTTMVVKGIEVAPTDMRQAQGPVARYLGDSELILFVSTPLYSGSCPPTAEAEAAQDGTVTLSIDDSDEGLCTADASRDTFLIQGFTDTPTKTDCPGGWAGGHRARPLKPFALIRVEHSHDKHAHAAVSSVVPTKRGRAGWAVPVRLRRGTTAPVP